MILPKREDALHKAWLYRVLIALIDNPYISQNIYFKGGTCASMLNFLDRFSIDLDFDLKSGADKKKLDNKLEYIFTGLALEFKKTSHEGLLFILKYKSEKGLRNTIKISIIDTIYKANRYKAQYLSEIDRFAICQTIETMFAHKLVTVTDRYRKFKTIAGRDIYDLHYFFTHGYSYHQEIIKERTGLSILRYLNNLIEFIEKRVNQRVIDQDLNTLLSQDKFRAIRKTLKTELLVLLQDEVKRITPKI